MQRALQVMLGAALASILAAGLMGGWGQDASAARPSLQGLLVQINQLNALVNQLQGQVDAMEPVLYVFDVNGTEIGALVDGSNANERGDSEFKVYLESISATVRLQTSGDLRVLDQQIFFSGLDCEGQAYVHRGSAAMLTGVNQPSAGSWRYFVGQTVPSVDLDYESRLPGATCYNDQHSGPLTDAVPADEILLEDLGLTFPLPAPLYIAPLAP